jgi:hypothetical protein
MRLQSANRSSQYGCYSENSQSTIGGFVSIAVLQTMRAQAHRPFVLTAKERK